MKISKINVLYKTKQEIKQKLTSLDDLFVMIRGEKYQKQCNKLRYALNSYPNIAGRKLYLWQFCRLSQLHTRNIRV